MRLQALGASRWVIRGTNGRAYQSSGVIVQVLKYHDKSKIHVQCNDTLISGFTSLVDGAFHCLE